MTADPALNLVLFVALPLTGIPIGHAQVGASTASDPNLSHPTYVVTAKRDGYTISGLVTHLQGATTFKHGIALFPGHPGIMKLREEDGQPRFELRGNFLVRSRRHWLDEETLVVVVDAPSDQWATFSQQFRESARYGTDVEALLKEVDRRYRVRDLPGELLWVHHEDDPCPYTPYRDAREFSGRSRKPLLTVRGGGPGRGGACEAFTAHGFIGVESETVKALRSWVKTGVIPVDVRRNE